MFNLTPPLVRSCVLLTLVGFASPALAQPTFNQIAITGGAAPGAGDLAEFESLIFGEPVLNDAGDVAFFALLRTGDAPGAGTVDDLNGAAIFGPTAGAGSPLGILAREDASRSRSRRPRRV